MLDRPSIGAFPLFIERLRPLVVPAALHPVPSRAAFDAQVERRVREFGDSHNPNDPNFRAFREATLREYGVDRIEDLPVNYNGLVMLEGERLTTEAYRAHLATLVDTYRRQERLVRWAGFVSPFVAVRSVSLALAGVDVPHTLEFERQAEDYRYAMTQQLNELHTHEIEHARDRYLGGAEGGAPSRQRIDQAHFQAVPPFAYDPPGLAWALSEQWSALLTLGVWTLVLGAAVDRLGRQPVRL